MTKCTHQHHCPDWDEMHIGPGCFEMASCTCQCDEEPNPDGVRTLALIDEFEILYDACHGHTKDYREDFKANDLELSEIRKRYIYD